MMLRLSNCLLPFLILLQVQRETYVVVVVVVIVVVVVDEDAVVALFHQL